MSNIQQIPLDQLRISSRNARRTAGNGVADLAASIKAEGLLQGLVVTRADDGLFEVVAGGRRLTALLQLQAANELPEQLQAGATCSIVSIDVADEASLAENTIREAMHPADQVVAYKTLVDEGKSIADIAARFSVTELFVKQRLKLANVRPELFELYRIGEMRLEQLQALALTDNHELQRQAWFSAKEDYQRQPHHLRERITQRAVPDDADIAKFVGIDIYTAAGGALTQDLFNTRRWLADPALLDRLAAEKLEAKAEELRAQGWSWVETWLDYDYAKAASYPRAGADSDAQEDFASMQDAERYKQLVARISDIEDTDADELDDAQAIALQDELDREEAEIIAIRDRKRWIYPTAVMQVSGAIIYVEDGGATGVQYARLRPGQKIDNSGTAQPTLISTGDAKPKAAAPSDAILQNLSAHRTEVIRAHIASDPHLAQAMLVESLYYMLYPSGATHILGIQRDRVFEASNVAKDLSPIAQQSYQDHLRRLKDIPAKGTLEWLRKRPLSELQSLTAILVASRFDGVSTQSSRVKRLDELHAAIGFDMSDHWNPGCDSYLARIPRELVIQAVTEAKGKDAAATLNCMKKAEAVAEAGKLLAGTGWLPKPLRGPSYGKKPAKPAAAAGNAKPKPAAKKAVAKKTPAKAAKSAPAKKAPKKTATKKTAGKPAEMYRNPLTYETWTGRGKQPRWMATQVAAGKKPEDFLVKAVQA